MTRISTEVIDGRLVVRFRCDECGAETPSGPGWEPIKPILPRPEPVKHRCPACARRRRGS